MATASLALTLPAAPDGEPPAALPILPGGDIVKGQDGRAWASDVRAVLQRLAKRTIVLDENHASFLGLPGQANAGAPAPAMARLSDFSIREDGSLWGRAEWTAAGRERWKGGEYLGLSPVLFFDPEDAAPGTLGSVADIHSVGLVNQPNLTLPALNCRTFTMATNTAQPAPENPPAPPANQAPAPAVTAESLTSLGSMIVEGFAKAIAPLAEKIDALAASGEAPAAAPNSAEPEPPAEHLAACNAALSRYVAAGKIAPSAEAKRYFMACTKTVEALRSACQFYDQAAPLVAVNATELDHGKGTGGEPKGKDALSPEILAYCEKHGWKPEDLYPEHFKSEAK